MGLFDVFSKGGKYFGKAIEPKCEYCEFGKRSSDGNKVLCTKKGMVDAGYHCPKFVYSPLKRIPVKQMNMVGFLEGDYDEKSDEELEKKAAAAKKAEVERHAAVVAAASDSSSSQSASAPAPANLTKTETPAAAPVQNAAVTPAAAPAAAPAKPAAAPIGGDLAALAAMADAAGSYDPTAEEKKNDDTPSDGGSDMSALSSM